MGVLPTDTAGKFPDVGLGWGAPSSIMSTQLSFWDGGQNHPDNGAGKASIRASIARELRYLLTLNTETSRGARISPTGLAHSVGVCLIEDYQVARGKGKGTEPSGGQGMPRFVDVKLSAEDRAAFLKFITEDHDIVGMLQDLVDDGYRVGVSWSGEHQSYTVSLTGRGEGCPNQGLCMTSFAGELGKAIQLALYKHTAITGGRWLTSAESGMEDFG